jgi:hypothetical protein
MLGQRGQLALTGTSTVEARRMIDGASLGPEALRVIGRAFDETWASIAGNFTTDITTQSARIQLASTLLSLATDDSRDVAALKQAALQIMAREYGFFQQG